jgi:serralysin
MLAESLDDHAFFSEIALVAGSAPDAGSPRAWSDIPRTGPCRPGDLPAWHHGCADAVASGIRDLDRRSRAMSGTIRLEFGTGEADAFVANAGEALIAFGLGGADTLTGAELSDLLLGNAGDDSITGNAGNDVLLGGGGNDTFNTGTGDDLVRGGSGDDNVGGMAGRDTVFGGDGADTVAWNDPAGDLAFGNDGDDLLRGGDVAADTIFGGDGDDLIRAVANQGLAVHAADILSGDGGSDAVIGGNANDTIEGGEGNDTLSGFGGADQFVFRAAQPGDDVVTDFDTAVDAAVLVGFGDGFDPLAQLSQGTSGTLLDLGEAGEVLFLGKLVNEFGAEDFILRA